MRRWIALLPLVLAAPLSAQLPAGMICTESATPQPLAKVYKGARWDAATKLLTIFYIPRADSVAYRCTVPTVTVLDTLTLKATRDTLTTVRAALKVATDSLAKWPSAGTTPPPPPPVDTTPTPAPSGTLKPAGLTTFRSIDFSQSPPGYTSVDAPVSGAPGWAMIENSGWTKNADGTWTVTFPAGSWGSPTSGWSRGSLFTSISPKASVVWFSTRFMQTGVQHPISNKFLEWSCSGALLLVQLKEDQNWLHAEQLINGGTSFWIDPGDRAGQVANTAVSPGVWHTIEVLIDLPAKTWKVALDGKLSTNASALPFGCTAIDGFATHAFRGGGGETLAVTSTWRFDQMDLGWK